MWLATGTIGGLTQGKVVPGEPMMFDAVSQRNFYHGDFGRTVVLEKARPGVKYSQLSRLVGDAMRKAYTGDLTIRFGAGPHSVGLQHTDQPYRDGLPFVAPEDLTLEPGMTLTVDLPTSLLGWGAIHHEDLLLVTRSGVEPLAIADGPLVVI